MTIAHGGGPHLGLLGDFILPVDYQDVLIPLQFHTAFRGELPVSNTSSLNSDDKFGSVISVEISTSNLYTSQSAFTGGGVTATYDASTKEWTMTVASGSTGSWRGIAYNKTDAVFSPGDKCTISFEVWANESGIPLTVDINNYGVTTATGTNDNDVVANRIFRLDDTVAGKWVKRSVTTEFSSSLTQNFYDNSKLCFANSWVPSSDKTIKIRNIQIEKLDWATTFVDGTRGTGRIQYPKELIPENDFTVNMWIAHTGDTRTAGNTLKLFALGMDVPTSLLTLWNYNPIGSDTRKVIADFGNDANAARQYKDLPSSTPFVVNKWEMLTITFNSSTRLFSFYRNGQLWHTHAPAKANSVNSIELYNSGWKYADLLVCPRIAMDSEIEGWFHYGKRMYDPYDYTVIYG